jgi:hypothetical protein
VVRTFKKRVPPRWVRWQNGQIRREGQTNSLIFSEKATVFGYHFNVFITKLGKYGKTDVTGIIPLHPDHVYGEKLPEDGFELGMPLGDLLGMKALVDLIDGAFVDLIDGALVDLIDGALVDLIEGGASLT